MCRDCTIVLLCPFATRKHCVFNEAEKMHLISEFRRRIFKECKEKEQRDETMPRN